MSVHRTTLMLRLNPSALSAALGQQLLLDSWHLRLEFEVTLAPLIAKRLLDRTYQRNNSGSIGLGGALTLFLIAYKSEPSTIVEVGTYIGNSALSMAFGAGLAGKMVQLFTCDINPCMQQPLSGLHLPEGSSAQVIQGSSTQMFQLLVAKQAKIDLLHLDGRLMPGDLPLLKKLIGSDTVIALDDCEGDEKGHINLDLLRREGILEKHVYIEPFKNNIFKYWGIEARSTTGVAIPLKSITCTRQ